MSTPPRLDPRWLALGEFDTSGDDRRGTRTMRIRDGLAELLGGPLLLRKLPTRGRAHTYYMRESDPGEPQAQYVMGLDQGRLHLGLSVEKGEERAGAEPGRRMTRTWSWHRLRTATESKLDSHLGRIQKLLEGRPILLWVETHEGESEDAPREQREYVYWRGDYLFGACPSSAADIVERIHHVHTCKGWWADVWIVAEYGPKEVAKMTTIQASEVLGIFRGTRDWLNGSP